ncbi:hypothetical protein Sjap_021134 [Stephania japonica]|uniref:Uncharacterized protein n=1 Tax=Stephania japonica TaxID=461633 RepID=A0AAP0F4R1_9MAGN
MATSWFGSSAAAPHMMTVTNTPAAELALTNLSYCAPSDVSKFAVRGQAGSRIGCRFVCSIDHIFSFEFKFSVLVGFLFVICFGFYICVY